MKTKHTKGPWEMLHEKDGDIWVFGNPKGRAAICRFLPPKNKYIHGETLETIDLTEENIANALLMSASPVLLKACKLALPELEISLEEAGGCDHSVNICVCDLIEAIRVLKEAIRKAGAE